MIASDFPELSAEDLAAQVRVSAEEYRAAQTAASGFAAPADGVEPLSDEQHFLPPLVLQPDFRPHADARYHVNDLLAFHDQHFVENAFQALRGRAPEPVELNEYLTALRGGWLTKLEILEALRAAAQRQGQAVRVNGLAHRRAKGMARRLLRVPVLGWLLRVLRSLWRVPLLIEHQQRFEAYALGQQQEIASYLNLALERIAQQQQQAFAQQQLILAHQQETDAQQQRILAHQQKTDALLERTQTETASLAAGVAGLAADSARLAADVAQLAADFANIAHLSDLVGDTAAVTAQTSATTAQTSAAVAQLSADMAGVSDRMAQTSAGISAMFDELASASESIVMLADVLAGLAAHSPELAVPDRLLRKQQEIEALAQSLSQAQETAAAANRELIVQEQFFIVEAQKAALAEVQRRLEELHEQHKQMMKAE